MGSVATWHAPCVLSHAAAEGDKVVVAGGGALHALLVDGCGVKEAGRLNMQSHVACLALSTVRVTAW